MPQQKDKRKQNRVKVSEGFEDIKVDLSTKHHFIEGKLGNVSLNGSAIKFSSNLLKLKPGLKRGDMVTLTFHVSHSENEKQLIEVVTVKHISKHILGAQFNNFSSRKYQCILNSVKDLMEKNKD